MAVELGCDVRRQPRPAVHHRQNDAGNGEARIELRAQDADRLQQLRQALHGVVLGLHRHEHAVGGGERVHGQRPERRGAVDEDEPVAVARRRQRVGQVPLARVAAPELGGRASEVGLAGTVSRFAKRVCWTTRVERDAVEQVRGRRLQPLQSEPRSGVRLRVEVDHEHALSGLGETGGEIDGRRGLADAALLVRKGVDRPGHAAQGTYARGRFRAAPGRRGKPGGVGSSFAITSSARVSETGTTRALLPPRRLATADTRSTSTSAAT